MKYEQGSIGRVFVARFDDNDDIIEGITSICRDQAVKAAVFHLVGGVKAGRYVVGPETEDMPPKPMWKELTESHETLAIGTVFWDEQSPKVHVHAAFGKGDKVTVGCLRGKSGAFLVLEAVIMEIAGIDAKRELDPVSGMTLLKV